MSGAEGVTPQQGDRRRWLKRLAWAGGALVVVVLLLHTPPARRLVTRIAVRAIEGALGAEVVIDRLDYRLWAGRASVEGVEVRKERLAIALARAEVALSLRGGLRLVLEEPRVLFQQGPPTSRPTVWPPRPWSILSRLEFLDLQGGGLQLRSPEGRPWLRLEGVAVRLERPDGRLRGTGQVAEAAVGWPSAGTRVEGVRGQAEIEIEPDTEAVRIVGAELAVGDTTVSGRGRLEEIQPIRASAEAEARIDTAVLRLLVPELDIQGRIDARATFEKDQAGARGGLQAAAAGVRVFGLGPWGGTVRGRLEDWLLHIEALDLAGYDGRAQAHGTIGLRRAASALDLSARGLDVRALVGAFVERTPPLGSRADASLRIALEDWTLDTLEAEGQVSLSPGDGPGWPLEGVLDVSLADQRVAFDVETLSVRQARLSGGGSLTFSRELELGYSVVLPDLGGAPALLADAGVHLPHMDLGGGLVIGGKVAGRLPEWQATGQLSSEGLRIEGLDGAVSGSIRGSGAGIEVESVQVDGEDGQVTLHGFIPLRDEGAFDLHLEVPEVRLTDALDLHGIPVSAVGRGRIVVEGSRSEPEAAFELEARSEPAGGEVGERAAVAAEEETRPEANEDREAPRPEAASLRVAGRASRRGVEISEASAEIGGGTVSARGTWRSDDDALDGILAAAGVEMRRLPWTPLPDFLGPFSSTLTAEADVKGRLHAPEGRLRATLSGNALDGEPLPDLTFEATLDGRGADLSSRIEERGLLQGRLSFEEPWPLHVEVDLAAIPATRLLHALPDAGVSDRRLLVGGQGILDLPLSSPDELSYELRVDSLEVDLGAGGTSAGPFAVSGGRAGVEIQGFELVGAESRLRVEGELGLAEASRTPLQVQGRVPLSDLQVFLPDSELGGRAELDLQVAGRVGALDVGGEIRVTEGRGRVGGLSWNALEVQGTAREGVLDLTRADVRMAGGEISVRGSVPVGPRARGTQVLEFEVRGVDPASWASTHPGEARLAAPLDASGRLRMTGLDLDEIEADGEITAWSLEVGARKLSLEDPARWSFDRQGFHLQRLRLAGSDGAALAVEGEWRPDGPLRVAATGQADLAFLNPFLGGELRLSGPSTVDVTAISGTPGELALEGRVSLENARAALREPALQIHDLSGTLEARGRTLELQAAGEVGDGVVRTAGTLELAAPGLQVDVRVDVENIPLTFPEGLRSRSSGRVRVTGAEGRYRVEGDLTVHRALFDRETDFGNQSLDLIGAELAALDERGSLRERVQLDLRVRLEEGLRVQNRQLDLMVDGAVALGGDLLTPELRGSLSIRDGGTVRLSRSTMRLVDGRIDLAGFPSRPPELNVSGRTQVTGIQVDVDLSGPLDDLRTTLSSPNRSDLTQGDLATLLLTGRTAQAAASESGAIVAEEVAAALGSALNERLGGAVLIDVSRDESLIVQDVDPTQRFNVGIPIGERLYVIYSQALDRSGVRWILDFRPTGRFRVRLITDSNESGAVEVSHSFDFDLWSRGRQAVPPAVSTPRIREIRVDGAPEALATRLRRRRKIAAEDRFDYFRAEADARRMREALVEEDYRAAQVTAREVPAGEKRVDVVFEVEPGPRIRVEWSGDDPGGGLRRQFEGSWDAFVPVEEAAARRARLLRNELRADGYYNAVVTADVQPAPDAAQVRVVVDRGPRGTGVDLAFEGNSALPDEALAAALPPPDTAAFFALLEPTGATRLATSLRAAGARAGFLSLEVRTPRQSFDPEPERLRVTIPVEEGERSTLVSLGLPAESVPDGASLPELKLRVGEPFHIDDYVADRRTIASWFRQEGFPDARVAGILDPQPGGMAVTFAVDAGPRPKVGAIRRARASRTRDSVVEEALELAPGDFIHPEALALTRDHLSETRVFRSVDVSAETTGDPAVRDLVIDLAERPDLAVEYKVRYETGTGEVAGSESGSDTEPVTEDKSGFQFGAGLEAANPFGWAHRYSVYGLVGRRRELYGTTFEAQTFFGRRWRTQVFAFDDSDRNYDNTSIARRIRNISVQQTKRWRSGLTGRRWHDRLRLLWGYAYKRINYLDPATGGELAGNRAGVAGSLIGDTRDSVTDPSEGFFWTVTAEPNLEALGSDKNLVRLYGQVFAYVPLGTKVVWAQALRVGVTPGEDPLLLLDRRFKAGGATSVRGFPENGLGPQDRGISVGGQGLFVFNQELRFPIWDRVYGGVFYDAGNVWALASQVDLGDLRSNVGAGVRVMFPFGPVRLDWAWVLGPLEGERRSRWNFALGHAF